MSSFCLQYFLSLSEPQNLRFLARIPECLEITKSSHVNLHVLIILRASNNKQLLDEVFRDIQNYQGRGKCSQPKAEADNTYRDLDNSGYHREGRGGGDLTKFNTGRLHPEVQPLILLYTVLAEKVPLLYTFY